LAVSVLGVTDLVPDLASVHISSKTGVGCELCVQFFGTSWNILYSNCCWFELDIRSRAIMQRIEADKTCNNGIEGF
jgi:hypothetical protein